VAGENPGQRAISANISNNSSLTQVFRRFFHGFFIANIWSRILAWVFTLPGIRPHGQAEP
jgi:hypothetical protein